MTIARGTAASSSDTPGAGVPRPYPWARDDDGVVTLTMDDPHSGANTMNAHFVSSLEATVDRLEAERDQVTGVILASAKRSWFAGGDLNLLRAADPARAAEETAHIDHVKDLLRRLEKLGRPVVAALDGSALGGGFEVALATHHRIAASDVPHLRVGLPEVSLGLLPGAGGITRTVRMLGLEKALSDVILPATKFTAAGAFAAGLVDELAPSKEIHDRAKAWIAQNPAPEKPWDREGFSLPDRSATLPSISALVAAMPARLRRQLDVAPLPAPRAAIAAAVEGAPLDFDAASLIETRALVQLTHTQAAKNMIKAFFFDLQAIEQGTSRPVGHPRYRAHKVGVLGAGMMGAAIAYVCAKAGIDVVLKDVSVESAEQGKDYARMLEGKAVALGLTTEARSEALLGRITATNDAADFAGVDLVIEAVFESTPVKQEAFRGIEDLVAPDAVLGSNTSTLPISTLAEGVKRPSDFIGVHFFSPADKMPLVEIIRGRQTSDSALAKAFDFVLQIRKTPIVVNDARGFFTSRVIGTFIDEALTAVTEGIDPEDIEKAALQAGYPAGPLQLIDELTLSLTQRIHRETRAGTTPLGAARSPRPAEELIDWMVDEEGRTGRKVGRGFYEYDAEGRRRGIWEGIRGRYGAGHADVPVVDLQERLLFAEALDAVDCLDSKVLTSVVDANIGSLFGIGFPSWTGGVLQYINQYDGGLAGFVARAEQLAETYGERFLPPASLIARATSGEIYE